MFISICITTSLNTKKNANDLIFVNFYIYNIFSTNNIDKISLLKVSKCLVYSEK